MKIIAEQNEDKFLVQMTKQELAYLLGKSSTWKLQDDFAIKEGSILNISSIWDQISEISSIINFNERMVSSYKDQIAKIERMKMPKFTRPLKSK